MTHSKAFRFWLEISNSDRPLYDKLAALFSVEPEEWAKR